jgi:CHAD domain-containing protein
MKITTFHYYLPEPPEPEKFFSHFRSLGRIRIEPPAHIRCTYFDTFDWRLHSAGSLLVEEREPYATRLRWQSLHDNALLGQVMTEAPRFIHDLPTGVLRKGIEDLVDMRALLPMAQVDLRPVRAAVLNKRGKTVLRLVIQQGLAGPPGTSDQQLPPRLHIEPIKGYRKPLDQALRIVEKELTLAPASHLLDEALDLAGREAEDYSGKLDVALQPEMPVGDALRRILLHLLETMECNLDGTRADLDSEFLHDFRVAVRRTRSLFSQVKGVLPPTLLGRFRAEFKWLGQVTGPTRDLDVYLLKLPGYRDSLPAAMQADLAPLQAYLEKHQRIEQRKLARQLGTVRCGKLLQDWRIFLEQDFDAEHWPGKALLPVGEVANRRIWKSYRRVLKEGAAIDNHSPAAALHELRIDCKKFRYLMEFFQSLYPPGKIRKQIKALKSLQDNLGDFQDLEVQAEALKGFGHQMQAESSNLPSETFMAMGVLVDLLYQRQDIERSKFAERFARFAQPDNRRVCKELFNLVKPSKETTCENSGDL